MPVAMMVFIPVIIAGTLFQEFKGLRISPRLSAIRRHDHRDGFPAVAAIDAEIAIDCDDGKLGIQLAHPNQAEVRKVGLAIGVAPCELGKFAAMAFNFEGQTHQSCFEKTQHEIAVFQMIGGLG